MLWVRATTPSAWRTLLVFSTCLWFYEKHDVSRRHDCETLHFCSACKSHVCNTFQSFHQLLIKSCHCTRASQCILPVIEDHVVVAKALVDNTAASRNILVTPLSCRGLHVAFGMCSQWSEGVEQSSALLLLSPLSMLRKSRVFSSVAAE